MRQTEEITIRFAADRDTPSVFALWSLCFPGEEAFRDYFFAHIYDPAHNLLLLRGGQLCAMAQMLPYTMQNGTQAETVTYIYGACTHPDCRRQHLMDRLLHRSFAIDREQGRAASILIPQEAWLFDFYAQFGYQKTFFVSNTAVQSAVQAAPPAVRPAADDDLSAMDALYHGALPHGPYLHRTAEEWHKQLALFSNTGGEVLCAVQNGAVTGYAFIWPGEREIWAQEIVCAPQERDRWIAALQQRYGSPACRLTGPQFAEKQALGCMLRYDRTAPAPGYINLMLN